MLGFLTALVRESVLGTEGVFGMVNRSFILRRLPGTLAGGLPRDLEAPSHSALAEPPPESPLHQGEHRVR